MMLSFGIAAKTMNPTPQFIMMAVTLNIVATELNYRIKKSIRNTKNWFIGFSLKVAKSIVLKLQKWHAPKNKSQLTTIWHSHQPSWHDLRSQRSQVLRGLVLLSRRKNIQREKNLAVLFLHTLMSIFRSKRPSSGHWKLNKDWRLWHKAF